MTLEKPLVSVIVITYNSAKYVLDTLESVKTQTYQNIELIVSDDCSTDNTVEICQNWINTNKERFIRVKIIVASENKGIPANFNQGLMASEGEWLKFIAGDDTLVNSCINDFILFTYDNKNISAIHAKMNIYKDKFDDASFLKSHDHSNDIYNIENITSNYQYKLILRKDWISAPTVFLKRDMLIKLGGWDEQMPYEDWPMFIKINRNGYKIYYMNKVVVNYRIHNESMYNKRDKNNLLFNNFFIKDMLVYKNYRRKHLAYYERLIEEFDFARKSLFLKLGLNHDILINRYINTLCNKTTNFLKRYAILRIKNLILK